MFQATITRRGDSSATGRGRRRGRIFAARAAIGSAFARTLDGFVPIVDRRRQCTRVRTVLGGGRKQPMIANTDAVGAPPSPSRTSR